jgi:orotidine-5'-phosphate decarboxylase
MLRRAVQRAEREGAGLVVCAVTILTSLDDADLADVGIAGPPRSAAVKLAKLAFDEGVRWFVCSAAEVKRVRAVLGRDAVLVTPGVRPAPSPRAGTASAAAASLAAAPGDQKRVATPEDAVRDGADWIVVGRPIRDAEDRVLAAKAIADAMARARKDLPS